ncbi:hypothetical protein OLMES_5417 [Oleiphilus messinensis]|uniref:TerD domain-containing protein n=1 Tax=Oleiphilus messinensis TaxID=141451 RepID=A0A1Y0IFT6_9GAMM|nr:TerD family protein [Oleiphilus messinensis]ARU59397.1 hypothetical protein OLMES_5417 [Oleiphilus messinensis]
MELVAGQSVSLAAEQSVLIDIGWRSASDNSHPEVFALALDDQKKADFTGSFIYAGQPALGRWLQRESLGKRFTLQLGEPSVPAERVKFMLADLKASNSTLRQVSHIQIRVHVLLLDSSGQPESKSTMLRMNITACDPATAALALFEVYRHKGQWKLRFLLKSWRESLVQVMGRYDSVLPDDLLPEPQSEPVRIEPVVAPKASSATRDQPEPPAQRREIEIDLQNGVELVSGQTLPITGHFDHIKSLCWQVRTVPGLDDMELTAMALNREGKVNNIKDFIYQANPKFRQEAIVYEPNQIRLTLDALPEDIQRLQLIAVRAGSGKRFSSADFVDARLTSASTAQPVCHFTLETRQRNYNCVVMLEIYRYQRNHTDPEWRIKALGQGYSDGLSRLGELHGFTAPRLSAPKPKSENPVRPEPRQQVSPAVSETGMPESRKMQLIGGGGVAAGAVTLLAAGSSVAGMIAGALLLAPSGWAIWKGVKQQQSEHYEANERMVLNQIRRRDYRVTAFELASDSPLTLDQVTDILETFIRKGGGTVEVTESGSTVYVFDAMKTQDESTRHSNW